MRVSDPLDRGSTQAAQPRSNSGSLSLGYTLVFTHGNGTGSIQRLSGCPVPALPTALPDSTESRLPEPTCTPLPERGRKWGSLHDDIDLWRQSRAGLGLQLTKTSARLRQTSIVRDAAARGTWVW